MYCWVIATPFTNPPSWNESQERVLIHAGTDEEEAVRVAKDAAPSYRKVVAKAIGGVLLYRQVNPIIEYASYSTIGLDDTYRGGMIPKTELYNGRDRDEAIAVARQHAGEFDRVTVLAMGEYEEGFDSRGGIFNIIRPRSQGS